MRGGLVALPVLNEKHPLRQYVTSESIHFGNATVKCNIIFGNTVLVLDAKSLRTFFVSKNEE